MNIWAWLQDLQRDLLRSGRRDLSDTINSFAGHVVEDRHHEVDAAYPVILSAARSLNHPWLEVWVRHWKTINTRRRGETNKALAEAVELLEFAHRDETKGCPQSVCAVQDVCLSYEQIDDVGFVDERLAVTAEVLERIDPSWACYDCITIERASALADANDFTAACELRLAAQGAMVRHRETIGAAKRATLALWLNSAGRAVEADEQIQVARSSADAQGSNDIRLRVEVAAALIHARNGELDVAARTLPSFPAENDFEGSPQWSEIQLLLARAQPERNTAQIGRLIERYLAPRVAGGSNSNALVSVSVHVELAVMRGARSTAERALATYNHVRQRLRNPDRLAARAAELKALIDTLAPHTPLPVPADELLAHFQQSEQFDPEQSLDWLVTATNERPDDGELAAALFRVRMANGLDDAAITAFDDFVQRHPSDSTTGVELGLTFRALNRPDDALRVAALIAPASPSDAAWIRANVAFDAGDHAAVYECCRMIVEADDSVVNTRSLWAAAAIQQRDDALAVRLRHEMIERLEQRGDDASGARWDLLVAATLAEAWPLVRGTAHELGMEFADGDGPIDERWSYIRVRHNESGTDRVLHCIRTGPVTALVISVAPPDWPQHVNDRIVFQPTLLEAWPEDEIERQQYRPLFPLVRTVANGDFRSFEIDGRYPGTEAWQALVDAVTDQGWELRIYSDERYQLDGGDDAPFDAVYGVIAIPADASPAAAHDVLSDVVRSWDAPFVWPRLAFTAGADMTDQLDQIERFSIDVWTPDE